jgi:hypothetical protein
MRRQLAATVAFCVLGVCTDAAWAQVPNQPPVSAPAVSLTAAVSADAGGLAVGAGASVSTAGSSGSPSVDAGTKAATPAVDVGASASVDSGGAHAALEIPVATQSTPRPRRVASATGLSDRASTRSESSPQQARRVDARVATQARPGARTPDRDGAAAQRVRDAFAAASPSLRKRIANEQRPASADRDADTNVGGNSHDEATPSAAGVSSGAALLSLLVILIPLVGWVFQHAAGTSPRQLFVSLLERPG